MPITMPGGSKAGGLGEKVENTLIRFMSRFLENAQGLLSDVIGFGIGVILEAVEKSIASKAGPMLSEIQGTPDLPHWMKSYIAELQNPTDQGSAMGLSGMAMGAASQMSSALLAPYLRKMNYWIDRSAQSARLSPGENFAARWRFPGYLGQLKDGLRDLGYTEDVEAVLQEILRPRLGGSDEIRVAWLLGQSTEGALAELTARGMTPEDAAKYLALTQLRPGAGDLINFGVREAWRDDVAAKWGYDNDFPGQFGAEMQRAGDKEGWAQKYWRAHWELPSLNMALEMLHREAITEAEFDEYLRIADYPSGWRERIKAVSFTPYTRVDTRRMYRFGVLDETGVYNTYRDIGYDHEHATSMTEFTVLDALEEERELTKSDVLKSYRLGRFTQAQAQSNLVALGYNATVAAMLLSNEDQAQEEAKIGGVVSNTHSLYIRGGIDRSEVITRLAAYNLATAEIDRYFELWDLEKESRVALPTRSSLDTFLADDIITVEQYQQGLVSLSYTPEAIAWYTQGVLLGKQTSTEKERERATDEAEKVAKRELATEYQKAKAQLTVQLREVEARVGELQNAIQALGLSYQDDLALARQRLTVEQLTREHEANRADLQATLDALSIENRVYRESIEELQTQIAVLRLQLEVTVDESLTESARLQIATLQGQKEAIQTIVSQGKVEIATLEAELAALVDPTLGRLIQQQIASLQIEIEVRQDAVQEYQVRQAQITRALLDAGPDEVRALKEQYLDLAIAIADELLGVDEAQTLIAGLREQDINPKLASDLHTRQELIAEIRANNAQGLVLQQEIDEETAAVRLAQIVTGQVAAVEALREAILQLRLEIDQTEDGIAANMTGIAELQADIRQSRAAYTLSLANLQRVFSVDAVEQGYRTDLATLQAELTQARSSKNRLRVQLAEIQYEYLV